MRRPAGTFGIISLDRTCLPSRTMTVESKRVIIKNQLGEKPLEKLTEHALIDSFGELVEITLVCPVICPTFPTGSLQRATS